MTILIVEDDKDIIEGLQDIFSAKGYSVEVACTGAETIKCMKSNKINLIILDIHLGEENGYDLCKEIRKEYNVPVLFLTACDSEMEIVRGFKVGGDDYVTKPFRLQELLVRVEALVKRANIESNGVYYSGILAVNPKEYNISKAGAKLDLTLNEWKMILLLLRSWPNAIARDELLFQIWDRDRAYVDENTLNVNVSRLRDKIGTFEGKNYIETIRGVGYRWGVPVTF